ncbi:hypothetical protein [Pelomonas sp. KK5]|uniref:hypothetical protein n=1 Tax=Pelomonas sp. KK5 TaxID=1855730 RepID=UPI00097BC52B|nr:hypothetical protein [Pelomonas sp. KK5]
MRLRRLRAARATILALALLAGCASDPNEGVFVINDVVRPKLTEARLSEIRSVWTPGSQALSESTKARRLASYWILDLIADAELNWRGECRQLELVAIRPREVGVTLPRRGSDGEMHYLRAATYHEAWVINACGTRSEWRVLDDAANPQNPMRVFRWTTT